MAHVELERVEPCVWEIPRRGDMRVPGRVFASEELMADIRGDPSLEQVRNVATLPGIVGWSLAMPDIHWGYGFPIGGVAATDAREGAISPGGVGYDINCGVRLARSELETADLPNARLCTLLDRLFDAVPSGVGASGAIRKLGRAELLDILRRGSRWAVERGFGSEADLDRTEEGGCLADADPEHVSARAMERGLSQVGTLGSGNHFLEIQRVARIFDDDIAGGYGLAEDQVVVMIHSGSRGFGYQICDDHLQEIRPKLGDYGYRLPDVQLAAAPIESTEGRAYLGAMRCAANYAWCNRQVMLHKVRETFQTVLGIGPRELGMRLVYDVCHNIAKMERHTVAAREREVCVHRKGATRAFPPGHPEVPDAYRRWGQPVLIPGSMGNYSFVCAGSPGAMERTFGSTCHGAGRRMSRTQAKKASRGRDLLKELADQGVIVRATGMRTVAEEMPHAYKDVADVVQVMEAVGVSRRVAELRPLGVVKG
jgi:tRNA-splicing ligase RtcB